MHQAIPNDNIVAFPQGGSRVNPQVEDGYIRIANELFSAILQADFSKREYKVLMAVMAKTYGYNKREDDVASVQLADLSGLHPNHVRSTIRALAARRVINVRKGRYGQVISINKHYDQWLEATKLVGDKKQPKRLAGATKLVVSSNQNGPHKRQLPKDNQTKDNLPSGGSRRATATPPCPHQEIIDLYHEILPMCPQVKVWNETRRGYLKARWREDAKRQNLEYWRKFFTAVRDYCPFLIGQKEGRDGKPPFVASLEWMVKPSNFAKIIERKYVEVRA